VYGIYTHLTRKKSSPTADESHAEIAAGEYKMRRAKQVVAAAL
jgi:hypothetical protein